MPPSVKRPAVFYGWWVVGACSLVMIFGGGPAHFGFTAVFEPIANEFRWSYTQISLAASIRGLETGLMAPAIGLIVDRWGPRRVVFGGIVILGLGLIFLSQINSLGTFYAAFVLIAIGITSTGHAAMAVAIANWFRRRIAVATGIMASGAALGGLMIPVVVALIDRFQWRNAMLILGLATWAICLPLTLLIRHRPEQYGLLPDGDGSPSPDRPVHVPLPSRPPTGIALLVAFRHRAFWHISLALALQTLAVSAVITHVMPYLSTIGTPRPIAALVATGLPVISVIGRLGFGWFGDRPQKPVISAIAFAMTGTGLLFFALVPHGGMPVLILYLAFLGIGWGGNVSMRVALLREYFGRAGFGAIHGFALGIMTLGNIAGAPFVGWMYDRSQDYQASWLVLAGLTALASAIVVTTPRQIPSTQL